MSDFKTSDLGTISFLRMHGIVPASNSIKNGEITFSYELSDEEKNIVKQYFNNQARVSPFDFLQTLKGMKTLIFQLLAAKKGGDS